MKDFRSLDVWEIAHAVTLDVYRLTAPFPQSERFGLTAQIRRASISIASNIAEGCGRGSDADFARFVQQAIGSASEIEYQLLLARDLGYLPEREHGRLAADVVRVRKMLIALHQVLGKRSER